MPDSIVRLDLIVEDPDAPASKPPVHAIVWDIPSDERRIAEGAIVPDSAAARRRCRPKQFPARRLATAGPTDRSWRTRLRLSVALSNAVNLDASPRRGAFVDFIAGKVLGTGLLIGTYSRGESAELVLRRVEQHSWRGDARFDTSPELTVLAAPPVDAGMGRMSVARGLTFDTGPDTR
jgi:hypothetical protein